MVLRPSLVEADRYEVKTSPKGSMARLATTAFHPLMELTMCERMKTDLLRSVTLLLLGAIDALTKAIAAKVQNALKGVRWTFLPSSR